MPNKVELKGSFIIIDGERNQPIIHDTTITYEYSEEFK